MPKSRKSASQLDLKVPTPLLQKPVKLDYLKLFKSIASGSKNIATGEWAKLLLDVADAAAAINLAAEVEERAYTLIHRSASKAILEVIGENGLRSISERDISLEPTESLINSTLSIRDLKVTRAFFDNPKSLEIVPELCSGLLHWLEAIGEPSAHATTIAARLPTHFQACVIDEWRRHSSFYEPILEALSSPFTAAEEKELCWKSYNAWLEQRVADGLFGEPFSLAQIYIPLNAYYQESKSSSRSKTSTTQGDRRRIVVELESELDSWLKSSSADDCLRVVSGGPGSGKSSFARIFASKIAQRNDLRVVFVELHKLDATKVLTDELVRYTRDEGFLTFDPLENDNSNIGILLILDGLDELASQGRAASETARGFVNEIERTVSRKNVRGPFLRVLLSGRELVVQDNETEFRRPRQVLTLLPYHRPESEDRVNTITYVDKKRLLKKDLRQRWWQNYGTLTGNSEITGLPEVLDQSGLEEVTSQPLLNYLVALSYTRGKINFDDSVNLNVVYADLVEAVYERGYDKNRRHISISHLDPEEFQRMLEEIALAAWHGDGRSTTVREIEQHCEASGLGQLMNRFQEGAVAGVTRLLAAFFFRQHGARAGNGDRTFVFTHKSFGEYLTGCRLSRAIARIIQERLDRRLNYERGWDEAEALYQWALICGPSPCTAYIQQFIRGELLTREPVSVQATEILAELFGHMIFYGLPMERFRALSYSQACVYARNAEESLLVALNASASVCSLVADIPYLSSRPTAFGEWLRKTQGQRKGPHSSLAAQCLSSLSLPGVVLDISDLYAAILDKSDLSNCELNYANLAAASLGKCNLSNANLYKAILEGTKLPQANLRGARLESATLSHASLTGANLSDARLLSAACDRADFSHAVLRNAQLRECDFSQADFSYADLRGADLRRSSFFDANLEMANLQGANLDGVSLRGANTKGAQGIESHSKRRRSS